MVPVALAKKITADSVRHLSQNTQYINTNAAGEIQPTHILNVTTEESYDLYENRFVYHLIQRLFAFVDKRTDVIFWATGDETCNVMSMESKVDDAYEEISYKVHQRIDRVWWKTMKTIWIYSNGSTACAVCQGRCGPVRSVI